MSKLTDIVVITESGGIQTLTVQNYAESDELEFWGKPFDEAIDGTIRSNIDDFRRKISLTYNLCTTPTVYESICNNIVEDIANGLEFIYIGIDTDNVFRVVLDDDFAHRVQYANQHGLFVPKITFRAYQNGLETEITLDFEDFRFVNEDVDKPLRDYGLITQTVTEQLNYGSI
jgi:hypothetical protein